jgi:hypothetical protein
MAAYGPNVTPEDTSIASEDKLLAAIVGARISEPELVATALTELRLESAAHHGRLDLEEWVEMMAAMRGAGVALGDRNKLRLLATGSESAMLVLRGVEQAPRRTQAEESDIDRQADVRRDSATMQARERASEQSGGAEQESNRVLGVSGDSASYSTTSCRTVSGHAGAMPWPQMLVFVCFADTAYSV